MSTNGVLTGLARAYLERVVNRRDLAAVDELVAPSYQGSGHGWPEDLPALKAFYAWQARSRPDWHIDVQESVEVGDHVAVRAFAGGTIMAGDDSPGAAPTVGAVEWLAVYRFEEDRIAEIQVLEVRQRIPD